MKIDAVKNDCLAYFKKINDAYGVKFITESNVSEPNKAFTIPTNKRWFEVSFMPSQSVPVGMGKDTQERIVIVMQIDICTPLKMGTDESDDKVALITQYFQRGTVIGDAEVEDVYVGTEYADTQCYRAVVRVNLTADIDK